MAHRKEPIPAELLERPDILEKKNIVEHAVKHQFTLDAGRLKKVVPPGEFDSLMQLQDTTIQFAEKYIQYRFAEIDKERLSFHYSHIDIHGVVNNHGLTNEYATPAEIRKTVIQNAETAVDKAINDVFKNNSKTSPADAIAKTSYLTRQPLSQYIIDLCDESKITRIAEEVKRDASRNMVVTFKPRQDADIQDAILLRILTNYIGRYVDFKFHRSLPEDDEHNQRQTRASLKNCQDRKKVNEEFMRMAEKSVEKSIARNLGQALG